MKASKRIISVILLFLFICTVSVSAEAAFNISTSGVTTPASTIKVGSTVSVRGILTANQVMKQVTVTIYKGSTCVQRYQASPNSKTFNLAKADNTMLFDKLPAGTYYYRVSGFNAAGTKCRVVNKLFTVKASTTTSSIKITNPVPSKDITLKAGSAYSIGGTITSTYKIELVGAYIKKASNNQVVYKKYAKPNSKTFSLSASTTLDAAMKFDRLTKGTYKFVVSVRDSNGKSKIVINRKITVTGSSNTPPATPDDPSTPAGFTPRTSRPAANNKYFYNGNYNIYYNWDSYAPTGKSDGNYYCLGNCAWYACGRALEIVANAGGNINNVMAIFGGDPPKIWDLNARLGKFKYGSTPKPGALIIFDYKGPGAENAHIAVVEKVVNGIPYVSESGYTTSNTPPLADKSNVVFHYGSAFEWGYQYLLKGYIYLI